MAIGRNRRGINRGESEGNGPPIKLLGHLRYLALGTLVDPRLNEAKLMRCKLVGADLVSARRHERFLDLPDVAHQRTFGGLAGNDHRAALAALGDGGGGLEIEIALGVPGVVAGEAVFAEDRQNLAGKIDRFVTGQFSDLQHGRLICSAQQRNGRDPTPSQHRGQYPIFHFTSGNILCFQAGLKAVFGGELGGRAIASFTRTGRIKLCRNSTQALTRQKKCLLCRKTIGLIL